MTHNAAYEDDEDRVRDDPYRINPSITIPTKQKLLISPSDIDAFDKESHKITKELPIRTGSLLRVPSLYYHNWGIGVTEENRQWLIDRYDYYRGKDYDEREKDKTIGELEKTPLSLGVRASMRRHIVFLAKELMTAQDDGSREFNIVDIAAGEGYTLAALASELWNEPQGRDLLKRINFVLVDYVGDKLKRAVATLKQYQPKSIDHDSHKDEIFLERTNEKFDIVISLCHLHKKPFLDDGLARIAASMAEQGVFLSGDWHSSLCNHPESVYKLLERMGIDPVRLRMFTELFKDFMDVHTDPGTTYEELKGREDHREYWAGISHRILGMPGSAKMARHYLLGSFDTTRSRVESIEEKGLIVDPDQIRKAFPNAKIPNNPIKMIHRSDRASVIMAMRPGKVR